MIIYFAHLHRAVYAFCIMKEIHWTCCHGVLLSGMCRENSVCEPMVVDPMVVEPISVWAHGWSYGCWVHHLWHKWVALSCKQHLIWSCKQQHVLYATTFDWVNMSCMQHLSDHNASHALHRPVLISQVLLSASCNLSSLPTYFLIFTYEPSSVLNCWFVCCLHISPRKKAVSNEAVFN